MPATPAVILYTRRGCHLCDEARKQIESEGLTVQECDIDADPRLVEKYTNCIPVVVIDGVERFRGRVNPILLRRLLARWKPGSSGSAANNLDAPRRACRPDFAPKSSSPAPPSKSESPGEPHP